MPILPTSPLLRAALACAAALSLAACGGGGGSSGGSSPTVAAVTITSANQKLVAADALQSATDIGLAQAGTAIVTGVQAGAGPGSGATLRLVDAARTLAGMVPAAATSATGVTIDRTVQCTLGGSLRIAGNVSGSHGVVTGDAVTITATNCQESIDNVATTLNGTMSITIDAGSFDSSHVIYPAHLGLAVVASNFAVAVPTGTDVASGDLHIDLTDTSATSGSMILTGTALATSARAGGITHGFTLRNYTQSVTVNGSVVTNNVTAQIETDHPGLGHVTYALTTPTPLTQAAQAFTGGSVHVAGRDSALLLAVTSSDAFSLQLDANGDGTYEATTSTTTGELAQL